MPVAVYTEIIAKDGKMFLLVHRGDFVKEIEFMDDDYDDYQTLVNTIMKRSQFFNES